MRVLGLIFAGTATRRRVEMSEFVRDRLGLEPVLVGGVNADLFELPDGSRFAVAGPRELGDTSRTVGFLVESLDLAVTELRAAGIEVGEPAVNDLQRYAHFRAPDGKLYELVEERTPRAGVTQPRDSVPVDDPGPGEQRQPDGGEHGADHRPLPVPAHPRSVEHVCALGDPHRPDEAQDGTHDPSTPHELLRSAGSGRPGHSSAVSRGRSDAFRLRPEAVGARRGELGVERDGTAGIGRLTVGLAVLAAALATAVSAGAGHDVACAASRGGHAALVISLTDIRASGVACSRAQAVLGAFAKGGPTGPGTYAGYACRTVRAATNHVERVTCSRPGSRISALETETMG